jgi:biopolymer transport protein ExbB/TolQ
MNRLHPLHIGALLVVVLLFSFFKLNAAKQQLHQVQKSYKESKHLALELSALKDTYGNKKKIQKQIQKIAALRSLSNAKIQTLWKKKGVVLRSSSLDLKALNLFMGKILNGNFNIVKLKITKKDDLRASLEMEIQW